MSSCTHVVRRSHGCLGLTANAQADYRFSRVRLYGSVENLLDSDRPIADYSGATPEEDTADILPPRTYWLGVELSF